MRKIVSTLFLLLLTALFPVSCSWDINPQPTVTVEKVEDISDGLGKIVLHFNPAIQQDIILNTAAIYVTESETVTPGQIEIPAWTRKTNINFKVNYNRETDIGLEVTFRITKVYGDCQIGEPSETTLKILK